MRTTRWGRLAVLAAALAVLAGGGAAQAAETNLALNAAATATVLGLPALPCTAGSGPENAVDGAASNIYTDKWCVAGGRPTLTLTLPGNTTGYTVSRIVVKHAGVAESTALNTKAFRILATPVQAAPVTVATVTANTASQTTHAVNLSGVYQVQLVIDTPTQGTNQATRIFEVEVWGEPTPEPPPTTGGSPFLYYADCILYYSLNYCCWNSTYVSYSTCARYVPGWYPTYD